MQTTLYYFLIGRELPFGTEINFRNIYILGDVLQDDVGIVPYGINRNCVVIVGADAHISLQCSYFTSKLISVTFWRGELLLTTLLPAPFKN